MNNNPEAENPRLCIEQEQMIHGSKETCSHPCLALDVKVSGKRPPELSPANS